MIVSFFFDIYEFSRENPKLLPLFYKFADFAIENNYKIIGQEKYFIDPEKYREKNYWATSEDGQNIHDYYVPSYEDLKKVGYIISSKDEKRIIEEYKKNSDDLEYENLVGENKVLEDILRDFIKSNDKIDCFLSWVYNASLDKVAKENNIKVIYMEITTIRRPNYRDRLGYFSFTNKYDNKNINDLFEEFQNEKSKIILSRKEILSLFLNTTDLPLLHDMLKIPEYDLGYALGLQNDKFEKAFGNVDFKEITKKLKKIYSKKEVLLRPHPAMDADKIDDFYEIDKSKRSMEWLLNCNSIICNISNIGYEAMLFGRGVIHISSGLPTAFNHEYNLDFINDDIIGIEKLSFITFGIYTPYDLLFDEKYIRWRLKNPSIIEIYNKNLKYIFDKNNIDFNSFKKMDSYQRLHIILKNVHNLSDKEIKRIYNLKRINYYHDLVSYHKELEKYKDELEKEVKLRIKERDEYIEKYNNVINSKSYRFMMKLQRIKRFIFKPFKK